MLVNGVFFMVKQYEITTLTLHVSFRLLVFFMVKQYEITTQLALSQSSCEVFFMVKQYEITTLTGKCASYESFLWRNNMK